ncbi:MAG: hypothetical protein ACK55Z_16235, partial [bacterium]
MFSRTLTAARLGSHWATPFNKIDPADRTMLVRVLVHTYALFCCCVNCAHDQLLGCLCPVFFSARTCQDKRIAPKYPVSGVTASWRSSV